MVGLALEPYFDSVERVLDIFADNASSLNTSSISNMVGAY